MTKHVFADSQGQVYTLGNYAISIPDPCLFADPSTYAFPLSGGVTANFNITTTRYNEWNVLSVPAWVTYAETDTTISASCNANNTESSRYGNIEIEMPRAGGPGVAGYAIPVGQLYSTPSMSISPTSWTYDGNGESKQFLMTSNVTWDVSANPAWVSIFSKTGQTGNGSFYGQASSNVGGSYRSGYITVKCTSYPNLYPAGRQAFVEQPAGRSLYLEYNSSQVYYTEWDSVYGYCCYPDQYASTLYMDLVCTAGEQWYCQFEAADGTFYKYPSSGTGSYSNFYVYLNLYQEYYGNLVFYWTDDDTEAYSINFSATDFAC